MDITLPIPNTSIANHKFFLYNTYMNKMKLTPKTDREIFIMREAGKRHAELIEKIFDYTKAGQSTWDIELYARKVCKTLNLKTVQIGYQKYPCAICMGINNDGVHTIPHKNKVLSEGDITTIDITVGFKGYCMDGGVTKAIGKVDKKARKLIRTTYKALTMAVANCVEGKTINDISNAIYTISKRAGFDVLKSFSGHGIGKNLHEEPYIPNFPFVGGDVVLPANIVVALDTMVIEGEGDAIIQKDGWSTKVENGGRLGFFENTVLVGHDSPEILNNWKVSLPQ